MLLNCTNVNGFAVPETEKCSFHSERGTAMRPLFQLSNLGTGLLHANVRQRSLQSFQGYYHWHQCCEILYVHQGTGQVIVNERTYEIKQGRLFFFQPFQLHRVRADIHADRPYERTIIHFDGGILGTYLQPFHTVSQFFRHVCHDKLAETMFELNEDEAVIEGALTAFQASLRLRDGQIDQEIEALLLLQLLSRMAEGGNMELQGGGSHHSGGELKLPRGRGYAEAIMLWLGEHYHEEFSLERLADSLHLSKYYVSRLFRQETGGTISDYLTARRMKQACQLLQTSGWTIERIGTEVGLPNPSYFCQLFKQFVGVTPHRYRLNRARHDRVIANE
ncbi:AraC family transcriptional regulator [Paenibacillaceae bacterium]|nr:AraC family transcriptional regulator [Paenibacillaceae bacterium]